LALAAIRPSDDLRDSDLIQKAAKAGVEWLLGVQNKDGGWPTFCRGWGKLPFDRSASDLAAHALRALAVWKRRWQVELDNIAQDVRLDLQRLIGQTDVAMQRGLRYLHEQQRADGSWAALWFGNQHLPGEENPLYGTARVLKALGDLNLGHTAPVQRGVEYLASVQQVDGGWGAGAAAIEHGMPQQRSSVEETAVVVDALLACKSASADRKTEVVLQQGLEWLVAAVGEGRHRDPAPVGFYFAKLWYYERLYPLIFTTAALGRAVASASESHAALARRRNV
jgi:squalene-hopene/tetraprenyl-beta-curcumene cyclase